MRRNPIARLAVMAVAVPVAARVLRKVGRSMQERHGGQSAMGDTLQRAASGLDFVSGRRQPYA